MRRSDIARYSIIPDGADYIFILLELWARARSRRVIAAVDLRAVDAYDALSHHPKSGWISRYGVMTAARAVSDFPRYCPRLQS